MPFSVRRRKTDGKSGREEDGSPWCGRTGGVDDDAPVLSGTAEGRGALSALLEDASAGFGDAASSSLGASRFAISSPSSASSAMVLPTGMFLAPSAA